MLREEVLPLYLSTGICTGSHVGCPLPPRLSVGGAVFVEGGIVVGAGSSAFIVTWNILIVFDSKVQSVVSSMLFC